MHFTTKTLVIATELPPAVEHISAGYAGNPVSSLATYESFDASGDSPEQRLAADFRAQQKEAFLSGEVRNPILNAVPRLQAERTKRRSMYDSVTALAYAQQLRREQGSARELEDHMVDGMLSQRANELGFVETAAVIAEGDLAPEIRQDVAEALKETSREIYGLPNRDRALSLMGIRVHKAEALPADDPELQSITQYIAEHLNMPSDFETLPPIAMEPELLEYYHGLLQERCQEAIDYAFAETPDKQVYDVTDMEHIVSRYLEVRGATDWQAKIVANRTMCAANLTEQIVEIGAERSEAKRSKAAIISSLLHECETHVGRYMRGMQLGSGIAGAGLSGCTAFEEQLAVTVEDIYAKKIKQHGEGPVIALALATGYDGVERDFRDTFELMWRLNFAKIYKPDSDKDTTVKKARNSAYNILVRLWRGMPTDIPGCVYTKDGSYENSEFVAMLRNDGKPLTSQAFDMLFQGRYDARQADQVAYVASELEKQQT